MKLLSVIVLALSFAVPVGADGPKGRCKIDIDGDNVVIHSCKEVKAKKNFSLIRQAGKGAKFVVVGLGKILF